jgi:hypothetical protein
MTEQVAQKLRPLFIEAEKVRPYPVYVRLLVWAGCFAASIGVWWVLIKGAARAIDLAKGY